MSEISCLIAIVLYIIVFINPIINTFHMFQLNGYKAKTYLKWLPHNINKCYTFTRAYKNAKKPVAFTKRMKIMLITTGVLIVLAFGLSAGTNYIYFVWIISALATPYFPLVANFLNYPIMESERRGYIKDAKRILAGMPELTVVGITGSYGKTSVKYYLTTILQGKFNTLMTPESFNTPMGVVKTIRESLKPIHEIFVCEMGARNKGDIKELCDIAAPNDGVITSVGEQHLETFGTVENIVSTKYELADAVKLNSAADLTNAKKGTLFLNGDNAIIRANLPNQHHITYGLNENNDVRAFDLKVTPSGTSFSIRYIKDGKEIVIPDLRVRLIGEHNIVNIAGAVACALYYGMSGDEIRPRLPKIAPPPHRLELLKKTSDVTIIDDAYNSNPKGCEAALKALAMLGGDNSKNPKPNPLKILITPGMVELGEKQDELNYEFGKLAAPVCDYVYLIGEKQTAAISRGLDDAGFDSSKKIVLEDVKKAVEQAYALSGKKVILLENDLPDNLL